MSAVPTVRGFMTPSPGTIDSAKSLEDAAALMAAHSARHLPVVDDGKLVGVLSQRDIAVVGSLGKRGRAHTVAEAMTPLVFTCGPEAHLHAVASEMADHKYGTAVIVERDDPLTVVGIFTTTDALRALALFAGHGVQ